MRTYRSDNLFDFWVKILFRTYGCDYAALLLCAPERLLVLIHKEKMFPRERLLSVISLSVLFMHVGASSTTFIVHDIRVGNKT